MRRSKRVWKLPNLGACRPGVVYVILTAEVVNRHPRFFLAAGGPRSGDERRQRSGPKLV